METDISEKEVQDVVGQVKHPAINLSLVELGMVRDITVEGNKVMLTFAFPIPNVPIREHLIRSVREPLERNGLTVVIKETVMEKEELQSFLDLEKKNWRG